MLRYLALITLSLTAASSSTSYAQVPQLQYQTLRASTANDVISYMIRAQQTHQPIQIRLAAGHYIFTRAFNSTYDANALPMVSTPIQIVGRDPTTTTFELETDLDVRFFTVLKTGNLSIYNLTLTGGADICTAPDCTKIGGGVVYNAGGEIAFHNCVLTGNIASTLDGSAFGGGGVIFNLAGHFLLDRTTVTGNRAETHGGAIYLLGGKGEIWNSIISGNEAFLGAGKVAKSFGAGIFVAGNASLLINGSTLSGNDLGMFDDFDSFAFGGGLYNSGTTSVINSAVTENRVAPPFIPQDGVAPGSGGGIFNNGKLFVQNSTIGGNFVGTLGGGIYNAGELQLEGATITNNSVAGDHGGVVFSGFPDGCSLDAPGLCVSGGGGVWNEPYGKLTVMQSAIGGNAIATDGFGPSGGQDCNGPLVSKGHNAIGNSSSCTLTPSPWLGGRPPHDLVNLDLRLGELQDDGVAGNVHYPLLADSPLIDAGGNVGLFCTATDQIGQRRVEGDADNDGANICDIGAIEFRPPAH